MKNPYQHRRRSHFKFWVVLIAMIRNHDESDWKIVAPSYTWSRKGWPLHHPNTSDLANKLHSDNANFTEIVSICFNRWTRTWRINLQNKSSYWMNRTWHIDCSSWHGEPSCIIWVCFWQVSSQSHQQVPQYCESWGAGASFPCRSNLIVHWLEVPPGGL